MPGLGFGGLTAKKILAHTSIRFTSAFVKSYENILTSRPESGVALASGRINRPKAVQKRPTALDTELSVKPNVALRLLDADGEIGGIVMADSERRSPSNER
ncbi:hypothetical protein BGY98DRAFT_968518 [Russula aff. rugulosa BPL654]|nr:hypothetical protein BGY98DRAFT_968518 [Russula aff. rugulosa BPL654]